MASSSSCGAFFGFREVNQMNQQLSSSSTPPPPVAAPPQKRRRNQPGTPIPDAEVVALSPRTLMATNRFICEVCNKGFQREQNLQLHRRGHNLPWKLKQKSTRDARRKVYLCPEPTCVHHHPSRALGDLTGIKKHYSRKHGEKKWQCHKCAKSYAVQSDCKAHTKTCGTKEYHCDCGTLFSRRDSFITHRAFCDALAQESPRQPPSSTTIMGAVEQESSGDMLCRGGSSRAAGQFEHLLPPPHFRPITNPHNYQADMHGLMMQPQQQYPPSAANLFNLNFLSNNNITDGEESNLSNLFSGNLIRNPMISSSVPSLYSTSAQSHGESYNMPHMSATALLQKAAQLGSTSSSASLLRNLAAAGGGARSDRTDQAVMVPIPGSTFGSVFSESENNNLQDLMNSLAASGSSSLPMFDTETGYIENSNASHKARAGGFGMGGDRLTRDFLGVGHAVTSMSGGGGGGVDDGTISSAISQSYGGREF